MKLSDIETAANDFLAQKLSYCVDTPAEIEISVLPATAKAAAISWVGNVATSSFYAIYHDHKTDNSLYCNLGGALSTAYTLNLDLDNKDYAFADWYGIEEDAAGVDWTPDMRTAWRDICQLAESTIYDRYVSGEDPTLTTDDMQDIIACAMDDLDYIVSDMAILHVQTADTAGNTSTCQVNVSQIESTNALFQAIHNVTDEYDSIRFTQDAWTTFTNEIVVVIPYGSARIDMSHNFIADKDGNLQLSD